MVLILPTVLVGLHANINYYLVRMCETWKGSYTSIKLIFELFFFALVDSHTYYTSLNTKSA